MISASVQNSRQYNIIIPGKDKIIIKGIPVNTVKISIMCFFNLSVRNPHILSSEYKTNLRSNHAQTPKKEKKIHPNSKIVSEKAIKLIREGTCRTNNALIQPS